MFPVKPPQHNWSFSSWIRLFRHHALVHAPVRAGWGKLRQLDQGWRFNLFSDRVYPIVSPTGIMPSSWSTRSIACTHCKEQKACIRVNRPTLSHQHLNFFPSDHLNDKATCRSSQSELKNLTPPHYQTKLYQTIPNQTIPKKHIFRTEWGKMNAVKSCRIEQVVQNRAVMQDRAVTRDRAVIKESLG